MTEIIQLHGGQSWTDGARFPLRELPAAVATAGRAPSVLNTQPWRFRLAGNALELHADGERALRILDPAGREMLISCGSALYGLRLAVRQLGYVPVVSLLPDPSQQGLLARIYPGPREPVSSREWALLAAVPHRHTHRGPFSPGPLPAGLLAGLQHDAIAEGAELLLVGQAAAYQRLAALVAAAGTWRRQPAQAEVRRWTRPPGSTARDGVPATTYPALTPGPAGAEVPGRLAHRDFDLGRGWGTAAGGGAPPAATAILATSADTPLDWLRAGQALQRILLTLTVHGLSASFLYQPIELRDMRGTAAPAWPWPENPQIILRIGYGSQPVSTPRRPLDDVLTRASGEHSLPRTPLSGQPPG